MSQEIKKWLIIKDNYVINAIIWDGVTDINILILMIK
jgi:hypothetical protein